LNTWLKYVALGGIILKKMKVDITYNVLDDDNSGYDGATNDYSRYLNPDGVDMSQVRICFNILLRLVHVVVLFMLIMIC